jgi:hypothetical protein
VLATLVNQWMVVLITVESPVSAMQNMIRVALALNQDAFVAKPAN